MIIAALFVLAILGLDTLTGGSLRALARIGASGLWASVLPAEDAIVNSGLFSTKRALEAENKELERKLIELEWRVNGLKVLEEENKSLRALLHLVEGTPGITAPVVSSFRTSPYGTFFVRAGEDDGIRVGHVVIAGTEGIGSFAIGRVAEVQSVLSLVESLFAPGSETDGVSGEVAMTLRGRGGGEARADIPRDAKIEVGDIVFSAESGGKAVGIVRLVELDTGGAFQRVYVGLPFSLATLQYVYIVE